MIVVGAPVHERGWILQRWFDALASQEEFPASELAVVLNYGPGGDDTGAIIANEKRFKFIEVMETPGVEHQSERRWDLHRYEIMAKLRNDLLRAVREIAPDYFLSCDTDMLLPSNTLQTLVQILETTTYDGVAPWAYMTKRGTDSPNGMSSTMGMRPLLNHGGTVQQWAVFGTVLMNRALYGVDYTADPRGEDIGWAHNVQASRLRLALCGQVVVKHVMEPQLLDVVDTRVGF